MANTPTSQITDSAQIPNRTTSMSMSSHGNYNVNSLNYPDDVSISPDRLHYVCFFINQRGKSKVFANNKPPASAAQGANSGENRVNTLNAGRVAVVAGAVMGGTAGLGLGRTLGKAAYSSGKSNIVSTGVKVVTGAVGAVAGAAAEEFAVQPDTTYRISDVITLHLPHAPKYSYGASYSEVELGTVAGMLAGGSSAADATKANLAIEGTKALFLAGASAGGAKASKLTGGGADQVKSAIQIAEGQSINPFREVLFKGMSFRKHVFNYIFMPKNAIESQNVFNIIKTFRYHQHPELSSGSLYLIHPSEFVIQQYFDGVENTNFPKMATCVLEGLDVQYGDGSRFSSFHDGSATEIQLSLSFREISTLTKQDISNGM